MMVFTPQHNRPSDPKVIATIIFSVCMVSSASILIRFSHSEPLVIVFWRTLYGALVMASLGVFRKDFSEEKLVLAKQNWRWLIVIGIILAFHFSTWFTSLFMTTVAASVVLVNTSPIFTAILSTIILHESLGRKSWAGVFIAVSGAAFLALSDWEVAGPGALQGDLLALLSGLFLAIYFIGGRRFASGIPISIYTSIIYIVAAMATLVQCVILSINVLIFDPYEVAIFLALAIFPTALGHSVNNYLLTIVPAYVVSSAVLGEPIGATILAIIFLGEIPTPQTLLGFVIILLGISLVLVEIATRERQMQLPFDDS